MAFVPTQAHQQQRGEVGKVKKVNKVEGNNRRALGDIGNLVTVRGAIDDKDLQKINRPVTRSFCAQLLANAQAAAENNKKVAVVVDGVAVQKKVIAAGEKVVQMKVVAVKPKGPKPETEIIEISPDTIDKMFVSLKRTTTLYNSKEIKTHVGVQAFHSSKGRPKDDIKRQ